MSRKTLAPLRREQILNGLYRSIIKKGFLKTSISDISKNSKLARGIIHYYFESKQEMLSELMSHLSQNYLVGLNKYLKRYNTPIDKLYGFIDYHLLREEEDLYALTSVWIEYWGQSVRDRDVNRIIFELQDSIRRTLNEIIIQGIKDGYFTDGNYKAISTILLGIVEGTMLQWRVKRESINLKEVYKELKNIIFLFNKKGQL